MIKLYSRFVLFTTLSIGLLASSGCGGSGFNKIKGKVSFSDGSPLTVGKIVAESPEHRVTATGYIKPDMKAGACHFLQVLNIEVLNATGVRLDEGLARRDVTAHQYVEYLIGFHGIVHLHF